MQSITGSSGDGALTDAVPDVEQAISHRQLIREHRRERIFNIFYQEDTYRGQLAKYCDVEVCGETLAEAIDTAWALFLDEQGHPCCTVGVKIWGQREDGYMHANILTHFGMFTIIEDEHPRAEAMRAVAENACICLPTVQQRQHLEAMNPPAPMGGQA